MARFLRLLALAILAALALAGAAAAEEKRRVALVIGNAEYDNWKDLKNPISDAELIARRLETLRFDKVERLPNGNYDAIRAKLKAFETDARGAALVVVYYTGHGAQIGGKPYIIPSDASPDSSLDAGVADSHAVAVDNLIGLANLGEIGLVLIDACRDNVGTDVPAGGEAKGGAVGMRINRAIIGARVLVQMSTQPDAKAYDGKGANSDYAISVDEHFRDDQHETLAAMLKGIESQVWEASGRTQKPAMLAPENAPPWWASLALDTPPMNMPRELTAAELALQQDEADWNFASRQNKVSGYETYLANAAAQHRKEAEQRIASLKEAEREHLKGTADEARRALRQISDREWGALVPEALANKVVNATTADGLRLLSEQNVESDPVAQRATIVLAALYDAGLAGLERSPSQALMLYQRAAEARHPTALRVMAGFARYGREGDPPRLDKAAELYQAAADGGDASAQDELGAMYAEGLVPEKPRNKAAEFFQAAADQEYAWGQCRLAAAFRDGALGLRRDDRKAFEYADKSGAFGNYCGEMLLGHMYLTGESGLKPDPARGAEFYEAAAAQKAPAAQTSLGILYQTGAGVDRDMAKAMENFHAAARQGYAPAQHLLGVIYVNGAPGVPRDPKLAVAYFREAAAQQFHPAEAALGWAYSEGQGGLSQNPEEAARLFGKAAAGQDAEGQYRLGYVTFQGKGVKKDPTAARTLMRASAAQGYAPALRWLNGHP